MYRFSRAIYRELAHDIVPYGSARDFSAAHEDVLRCCERAIERLATDRHYFARPTRTLFNDIRGYFPVSSQRRVYEVIDRYLGFASDFLAELPLQGYDINGNPLQCRATTRKGSACQRTPLPHNGYCPSHQHLAETEDMEEVSVHSGRELHPVAA
jgi:hypothetical protein